MLLESLNILVTDSIGDHCLQQIAAVSPRIKVTDVSHLLRAEHNSTPTATKQLDLLLADAEVIFGFDLPRNVINRTPRLKWVQIITVGVDHLLATDILKSPVTVTNIRGMSATPIAEFILTLILMFVKRFPLSFQLKQQQRWQPFPTSALQSKTIGIVGFGNIGQEVARLAKAFGLRVLATRQSTRRAAPAGNVDLMLPRDRLLQLLSESDFVVLTLPLTPQTNKLIDEKELRTMKPTACLINVARGDIINEEALIRALEEHWIAAAGLDVFATEPLPVDSRLWEIPNVILSPHVAGAIEDEIVHVTQLFVENLKRYLNGKKLLNLVDKEKGY